MQAQRILVDGGKLVQIGAETFRFDLKSADAPSDSGPMPGGAPETQPVRPHCAAGCRRYLESSRLALALAERELSGEAGFWKLGSSAMAPVRWPASRWRSALHG